MSTRITEPMRAEITHQLVERSFAKKELALQLKENELAQRIHRLRYSPATLKAMDELLAGWLPTMSYFWIASGEHRFGLRTTEPLPVLSIDNGVRIHLDGIKGSASTAAAVALEKHYEAVRVLASTKSQVQEKTRNTLSGFYTLKSLLLAWPEIKPIIDKLGYSDEKKSLPAVIPTGLNASLDLPIKEAA